MAAARSSRRLWIAAVGVIAIGVAGGAVWYQNREVSASSIIALTSTVPPPEGTGYGYGAVLLDDSYFTRFDAGDTKKALVTEMASGDPGAVSDFEDNLTITRAEAPIALTVTGRAHTSRQAADLANTASDILVGLINKQDPAAGLVFMSAVVSTRASG